MAMPSKFSPELQKLLKEDIPNQTKVYELFIKGKQQYLWGFTYIKTNFGSAGLLEATDNGGNFWHQLLNKPKVFAQMFIPIMQNASKIVGREMPNDQITKTPTGDFAVMNPTEKTNENTLGYTLMAADEYLARMLLRQNEPGNSPVDIILQNDNLKSMKSLILLGVENLNKSLKSQFEEILADEIPAPEYAEQKNGVLLLESKGTEENDFADAKHSVMAKLRENKKVMKALKKNGFFNEDDIPDLHLLLGFKAYKHKHIIQETVKKFFDGSVEEFFTEFLKQSAPSDCSVTNDVEFNAFGAACFHGLKEEATEIAKRMLKEKNISRDDLIKQCIIANNSEQNGFSLLTEIFLREDCSAAKIAINAIRNHKPWAMDWFLKEASEDDWRVAFNKKGELDSGGEYNILNMSLYVVNSMWNKAFSDEQKYINQTKALKKLQDALVILGKLSDSEKFAYDPNEQFIEMSSSLYRDLNNFSSRQMSFDNLKPSIQKIMQDVSSKMPTLAEKVKSGFAEVMSSEQSWFGKKDPDLRKVVSDASGITHFQGIAQYGIPDDTTSLVGHSELADNSMLDGNS